MIGTVEHPLSSTESKEIAEVLLKQSFKTPGGKQGIIGWRGAFWHWDGTMWRERGRDWLDRRVLMAVGDMHVEKVYAKGRAAVERLAPEPGKAKGIADYIDAMVTIDDGKMPSWVGGSGPDPDHCVGFLDGVVDVAASARAGVPCVIPRDECWFDNGVIPCNVAGEVPQPGRWLRCLEEWGQGDPQWSELHRRAFGYALMGTRKYQRWFLWYGKVRSGKGTSALVLQAMLGNAYLGMDMRVLAGPWGLGAIGEARVLVIDEVTDLEGFEGEAACANLKTIVSGATMTMNVKTMPLQRGVKLRAVPILQTNLIPNLPNKGQGLSSKMLLQPFNVSFKGKEDWGLEGKLRGELSGIARWALNGAVALEAEQDPTKKFSTCGVAQEGYQEYRYRNNKADAMLEEVFVKDPTLTATLAHAHGAALRWGQARGVPVPPRNQFAAWLEREGTWHFDRVREGGTARALRGLGVRAEWMS